MKIGFRDIMQCFAQSLFSSDFDFTDVRGQLINPAK
jgi:hypothetical protein